jgi:hypothetical protein
MLGEPPGMRAVALALVLAYGLLTGCIQAGIDAIEESREERRAREQESSEEPEPFGPPTPPRSATPTPTPTPPVSPVAPPSPIAPPSPVAPSAVTPPPRAENWPVEGSTARFVVDTWVDGRAAVRTWANWTYEDGDWTGTCEGLARDVTYEAESPPHWPLFNTRDVPDEGEAVRVWYLWECSIARGEATYHGVTGDRHHASTSNPFDTEWDAATGLVVGWDVHDGEAGSFGRLSATDAPLSGGLGYAPPHG